LGFDSPRNQYPTATGLIKKQKKGSKMSRITRTVVSLFSSMQRRYLALCVAVASAVGGFVTMLVAAPGASATESAGAKAVKEATTTVSSEGVEIIVAVLTGLVALIALAIILPKAIGFIRRFI
jgi:ABC-type multidrug transport system fused ATPase/permease subunit